jgi:hypothetical protein
MAQLISIRSRCAIGWAGRAKTYYAAPPSRRGNSQLETLNTSNIQVETQGYCDAITGTLQCFRSLPGVDGVKDKDNWSVGKDVSWGVRDANGGSVAFPKPK